MTDMTGRTCVVTGSARGIGQGIAEDFGAHGANVVVNYRASEEAAAETVAAVEDAGGEAIAVQANVTEPEELRRMRERAHEAFGGVDVLVNNAGVNRDTRFQDMTTEEWTTVMEVNLGGTFNATKTFYEDLREAAAGRLINISSVVGKQGNFGQANYAAAKSGMFGFTRTLALELAASGATANCVAPGFTRTDMLASVPERVREDILSEIPVGRFAEIEDIAGVVRFLAGPDADYVTGEVIDVTGGMDL